MAVSNVTIVHIVMARIARNDTQKPRPYLVFDSRLTPYAQRMLIENALFDALRFFHIDALSSVVGLKVDFDMALLVLASGLYRRIAQRMRGYGDAQARQIFRDLINMSADVTVSEKEVSVSFHRRAHLPIILASGLTERPLALPWWGGSTLRLTTYNGPRNSHRT